VQVLDPYRKPGGWASRGKLFQIVLENNPITSFTGFQVFQGVIGPRHWKSFDYRRNLVACAKLDHPARIQPSRFDLSLFPFPGTRKTRTEGLVVTVWPLRELVSGQEATYRKRIVRHKKSLMWLSIT
jgi:hypothetical protein